MPSNTSQIGIIGLAAMGSNLARNFAKNEITVSVYNRTSEITDAFISDHNSPFIKPTKTLEQFVESLEIPRKIIILIKTGDPIDLLITNLTPLLEPSDILIDMGNSHFKDTERRSKLLTTSGIEFFGCGISGGEKGALEGPSLMPGGKEQQWKHLQPLFEKIAAKDFNGQPCVALIGPPSAGHYVKMVHNGIEYGIMQAISEIYQLYRDTFALPANQISEIFRKYNAGPLNSFLIDLTSTVLSVKDPDDPKNFLIDKIQDIAAQKGTGNWTAIETLELGTASPSLAEAVYARVISNMKTMRGNISKDITGTSNTPITLTDKIIDQIESALYFSILTIFSQGYNLLSQASKNYNWNLNLAEISRIWEGGCIIRAKALTIYKEILSANDEKVQIQRKKQYIKTLEHHSTDLREILKISIDNRIPMPVNSSTLAFFDNMSQARGSANLIQALRDAFGAHTFERTDKDGAYHVEWL